jgi:hypothetical protein
MMLLGTYGADVERVKALMQRSVAGEQTLSLATTRYQSSGRSEAGGLPTILPRQELESVEDVDRIHKVMLRFVDACVDPGESDGRLHITLSLDDGSVLADCWRGRVPERFLVQDESIGESIAFDLTAHKGYFVARGSGRRDRAMGTVQRVAFSVAVAGAGGASFSWKSAELDVYFREA